MPAVAIPLIIPHVLANAHQSFLFSMQIKKINHIYFFTYSDCYTLFTQLSCASPAITNYKFGNMENVNTSTKHKKILCLSCWDGAAKCTVAKNPSLANTDIVNKQNQKTEDFFVENNIACVTCDADKYGDFLFTIMSKVQLVNPDVQCREDLKILRAVSDYFDGSANYVLAACIILNVCPKSLTKDLFTGIEAEGCPHSGNLRVPEIFHFSIKPYLVEICPYNKKYQDYFDNAAIVISKHCTLSNDVNYINICVAESIFV